MKLYQSYKKVIEGLKNIELVWFTTFNLDMELVEKYLMPPLVGKDHSELRTAEDYEALNFELYEIDIKIFYDFRALNSQSDKRTTLDIIPVNPKDLYHSENTDAVFHPKVIFIKAENKAYLIAGSANLTISAWNTNCESILIKEIVSQKNADQLISFFEQLNVNVTSLQNWKKELPQSPTNWDFVCSLNSKNNIIETILNFNTIKKNEITVWSPYFSRKTCDLIDSIKNYGFNTINLIPDCDETGKIRISDEELNKIKSDNSIKIYKNKSLEETNRFYHAKVWLTESVLAVGSWNFSFPATGLKKNDIHKNIEAGIISNISKKQIDNLFININHFDKSQSKGSSEEELINEWNGVLNQFSFSCCIYANWNSFTYEMDEQFRIKNYYAILPHDTTVKIPLEQINKLSFKEKYKKLLKNKAYTIIDVTGKEIFRGFLIEKEKKQRPSYSYVSIFDFLESYYENPLGETIKKSIQYKFDIENADEYSTIQYEYKATESYYLMFIAFQKLFDEISINKNDRVKLDKIGFRLPGSLINISELTVEAIEHFIKETNENNLLFFWFVANEINRNICEFNKFSDNKINLINIENLQKKLKFSSNDIKFIEKSKTLVYASL